MVRTNTIVLPGLGCGVVRVKGTARALAMSVDGQGRFGLLDPRQGARLAVAESARNVACAGALPIAATNNLNFGNPQKPDIMWQFARGRRRHRRGLPRARDADHRRQRQPLQRDRRQGHPPDAGARRRRRDRGCLESADAHLQACRRRQSCCWGRRGRVGRVSEYLYRLHGLIRGQAPTIDLDAERRLQRLLVDAAAEGLLLSAHDCSEGGIAVTLAECCFDTGGLGATSCARPSSSVLR